MLEFVVFKDLIVCKVESVFYVFEVLVGSVMIGFVFVIWFVIYEMCYEWLLVIVCIIINIVIVMWV